MAVFPKRITLKNSPDTQVDIVTAISAGGDDEILPGEVVVGTTPGDVRLYTMDDNGLIVSFGNIETGSIGEAPKDGKQYARQDATWTEVEAVGGGINSVVEDP